MYPIVRTELISGTTMPVINDQRTRVQSLFSLLILYLFYNLLKEFIFDVRY